MDRFRYVTSGTIEWLVTGLGKWPLTTTVRLKGIELGKKWSVGLAMALKTNRSVKLLRISESWHPKEGIAALAEALAENATLTELRISEGGVDQGAFDSLLRAMHRHPSLRKFRMKELGEAEERGGLAYDLLPGTALEHIRVLTPALPEEGQRGSRLIDVVTQIAEENRAREVAVHWGRQVALLPGGRGGGCREGSCRGLCRALNNNTALQVLNLSLNALPEDTMNCLCSGLAVNRGVKELLLEACQLGRGAGTALAWMMQRNRSISHLSVACNTQCHQARDEMLQAFRQSRSLRRLNMSMTGWGAFLLEEALSVACFPQLHSLALGHCGVDSEHLTVLASNGARLLARLRYLDLSDNLIECDGVEALAGVLADSTTLVSVNLEDNAMGDNGLGCLAQALVANRHLSDLLVSGNPFGDAGIVTLARALEKNRTLKRLTLDGVGVSCTHSSFRLQCRISEMAERDVPSIETAGMVAVGGLLARNGCALEQLRLGGPLASRASVMACLGALEHNTRLTSLSLVATSRLSSAALKQVAEWLRNNSTVVELELEKREYPWQLESLLQRNSCNKRQREKTLSSLLQASGVLEGEKEECGGQSSDRKRTVRATGPETADGKNMSSDSPSPEQKRGRRE